MEQAPTENSKRAAPGRPFKKGISGNPGGRPKSSGVVKEYAQKFSKEAVDTLLELMRHAEAEAVRKAAADSLLDRAIGKPAQAITGPDGEKLTLSISIGGPKDAK